MTFQIHPMPEGDFQKYFAMDRETLKAHNAQIHEVTSKPGAPCRVGLVDADIGSRVVLVNHEHQPENSPYRSSHAIYVQEGAVETKPKAGDVPEVLSCRTLSVRGFDADHCIQDADLVEGADLAGRLDRIFEDDRIRYAHVHFAGRGCFAAKVTRA